jgi:hypothetical protein
MRARSKAKSSSSQKSRRRRNLKTNSKISDGSLNIVNVQNSNLNAIAGEIDNSPFGKQLHDQSFSTHARNNFRDQHSGLAYCTTPPAIGPGALSHPLQNSPFNQNQPPLMDNYTMRADVNDNYNFTMASAQKADDHMVATELASAGPTSSMLLPGAASLPIPFGAESQHSQSAKEFGRGRRQTGNAFIPARSNKDKLLALEIGGGPPHATLTSKQYNSRCVSKNERDLLK